LLESLKLRLALQDSNATAMSLMDLAEFYQAIGNTDSAMAYAEQALLLAKKIQYIDLQRHALLFMAESFESANEPAKALAYFRSHAELKDSIFNEQKSEQIAEMQTRFETEKKEQEIALQEIEIQQRNYLLIGLILLVAIAAAFAYVFYSRKQLMLRNNFQQEIIKQQDLNTRAIITAEENERKRIATELHDGIGQLFSAVKLNLSNLFTKVPLENSQVQNLADKTIALVDESCIELRSISHNMMPNVLLKKGLTAALRDFIEKIDAEQLRVQLDAVGLKEGIDQNTETVLYRVIQELVNNVIKHSQANQLFIQIDLSENEIRIHIEDNGIGFVVEDAKNKGGLGLANVMTRIEFLKGSVEWDSSPGRGSLVSVFVPLN